MKASLRELRQQRDVRGPPDDVVDEVDQARQRRIVGRAGERAREHRLDRGARLLARVAVAGAAATR